MELRVYMHSLHSQTEMAQQFFNSLLSGGLIGPNALINEIGPLPSAIPPSAPAAMKSPDGLINNPDQSRLLQGGLESFIYAYGPNPERITTQTQNNIPNKVQLIIPKIFIPTAQSDGSAYQDPILEHSVTDGDLVFSLKMNKEMTDHGTKYVIYPMGYSDRAVKLVNLATVNYILWGLQVGSLMPGNRMWLNFFQNLCKTDLEPFMKKLRLSSDEGGEEGLTLHEMVWNFIKTYIAPFGVQHGFDTQGGQHEGSKTRVVTNAVDYVSSFAVEGKILKVNNLWKTCDVYEDDDLVLALRYMKPQANPVFFNLSSSNRSHRTERTPVPSGWWYLNPEVLAFKTLFDTPHIHVGRSQKMVTAYANPNFGNDMPAWNARSAIHGTPLQITFQPCFMSSDKMCLKYDLGYPVQKKIKALNLDDQSTSLPTSTATTTAEKAHPHHAYVPPKSIIQKRSLLASGNASAAERFAQALDASSLPGPDATAAPPPKKKKTVTISADAGGVDGAASGKG